MVNTKFIHVFVQIKIVAMVHESVEEKKKRLLCRDLPAALFALRSGGKASPREKGTEKGTDRTRPVRTFFRTLFPWRCFAATSQSEESGWEITAEKPLFLLFDRLMDHCYDFNLNEYMDEFGIYHPRPVDQIPAP